MKPARQNTFIGQPVSRLPSRFKGGGELETANEILVELIGIEPMTPCLQSRCSPN
jgi:hypothetical protein